jgi:hypothetical protein
MSSSSMELQTILHTFFQEITSFLEFFSLIVLKPARNFLVKKYSFLISFIERDSSEVCMGFPSFTA